jgi:hypothetical protein
MNGLFGEEFRHLPGMRLAAIVAAFLIGLVTGVAATPEANAPSAENSQRRQIVITAN